MNIIMSQNIEFSLNDLPSMLERSFILLDEDFQLKSNRILPNASQSHNGPYGDHVLLTFSTNASYDDQIKEYYDAYVLYEKDAPSIFRVAITVYKIYLVSGETATVGSKNLECNRSELNRIPYDIVKAIQTIIREANHETNY